MQILEQWCTQKTLSQGSNIFNKGLGKLLKQWRLQPFYRGKWPN